MDEFQWNMISLNSVDFQIFDLRNFSLKIDYLAKFIIRVIPEIFRESHNSPYDFRNFEKTKKYENHI